jgi:hypothetical protein
MRALIYILGKTGPEEDRWTVQQIAAYIQVTPATVRRIWREFLEMFRNGEEHRAERGEDAMPAGAE